MLLHVYFGSPIYQVRKIRIRKLRNSRNLNVFFLVLHIKLISCDKKGINHVTSVKYKQTKIYFGDKAGKGLDLLED